MLEFLQSFLNPIQLIGYLGMTCALVSYQCKKNKAYFLFQMGCAIAFTLQFLLLASWAGMFLNLFSILRGVIFSLGDKCKKIGYLILIEICFAASCLSSVLFFNETWWIAVILFIAQGGGTLAMWTRNGKIIRITQLSVMSPLWIVHNVYYFTIGGIACELFNIGSVIVSFLRFKKTGFDQT